MDLSSIFGGFMKKKSGGESSSSVEGNEPVDYAALGLTKPMFGREKAYDDATPMPADLAQPREQPAAQYPYPSYRSMQQMTAPQPAVQAQNDPSHEAIKAKLDLISSQIDSLKAQHETINQRLAQIEQTLRQAFSRPGY